MRVFLLAQQHNAELGPELKLRLRRRLYMIDRRFIYQTAVRETLLAIFSRKGQVGRALRTMHELGFLGRFFPEFRPLTCLVQHEFFHRYTADEHTLVCIEMLDKIIDANEPPFSKYKPLLQQTARPHILYLAMLLHDTGKSENDQRHAEASAVNAVRVARRMRLKGTDLSTLVFLVDHHLTMSEIARRKNLDNEDTIIEFARIVQTQERLDLLMLLTFADTLGTGSGRGYSDWKDLLLWQLYHRTTSALSGVKEFRAMAEKARLEIQQRLLKNLDRQFDPAEVVAHFENLPPSYFETDVGGPDPRAHRHRPRLPQVPAHPRRRLAAARSSTGAISPSRATPKSPSSRGTATTSSRASPAPSPPATSPFSRPTSSPAPTTSRSRPSTSPPNGSRP